MFRRNLFVAFIAMLFFARGAPAHGAMQTVTVTATQDTSIYNGTPGSSTLADGSGDFLWLSVTAEGLVRRMLVKFDLSAIPQGVAIRQVSLSLYESRARDTHDVALHRLLAPWGEGASNAGGAGTGAPAQPGDATWLHRFYPATLWTTPGGDFDLTPSAVQNVGLPNTNYVWAGAVVSPGDPVPRIVQDVQSWVDAPATNHGWMLIGAEAGQQNAKRFESRDNAAAANRPRLTVVYEVVADSASAEAPLPLWELALLAALLAGRVVSRSDHR